jgi:hypothetical protein
VRGVLTTIAIATAAALAYPLSCVVRPYRDCWLCKGTGHHRSATNRRLSRPCRWCRSTGKRLRLGRRAWNRAREKYRDGTR